MTPSAASTELSIDDIAALTLAARAHADAVIDKQWQRYASDPRIIFDEKAANAAAEFFPKYLRHSKGKLAGQPFHLEPWEDRMVRMIFGFKWKDSGLRVIRRIFLFIARKNGKSTLAAGLALLLLIADGEESAEIYGAAADADQAAIVFKEAKKMIEASPALSRVTEVFDKAILCTRLRANYQALSSIVGSKHGLNPHGIVFDELHTQEKRDLYDVLKTAVGARQQPMEIYMTTAGYDLRTICGEVYDEAKKTIDGAYNDLAFLPIVFEADEDDDFRDPKTWIKANPNIGCAITFDYLQSSAASAARKPSEQNTFRRLHLNQWTAQETRWIDQTVWNAGAGEIPWHELPALLDGMDAYGGLDLSSTQDITAKILIFPPEDRSDKDGIWHLLPRFYIPRDRIRERAERDRVPYDQWVRDGALIATDGNVVDYSFVKADIMESAKQYRIVEFAYDRWNATQLVLDLQDEGVPMVQFAQSLMGMNAGTKFFEDLVIDKRLRHGGHPVMSWMIGNVQLQTDGEGNMKPSKSKSREKIDGVVAAVMGVGRAIAQAPKQEYAPLVIFV